MLHVYEVTEVHYEDDITGRIEKSTLYQNESSAKGAALELAEKYAKGQPIEVTHEGIYGLYEYLYFHDPKKRLMLMGSWSIYVRKKEVK